MNVRVVEPCSSNCKLYVITMCCQFCIMAVECTCGRKPGKRLVETVYMIIMVHFFH